MQNSIQQKMFKRISRWKRSGLSQKAWCEKNDMAYATFHYWYKLYRDQVSVPLPDPPDNFIKLMVNDSVPGNSWCEVVLSNGKKLVFQQPVSAEFLRLLID